MDTGQANANIVKQRWPELWSSIDLSAQPSDTQLQTQTPVQTLIINGIHLTSSCDRAAEAQLQVAHLDDHVTEVSVYGFALGDIQRELLKSHSLQKITVVIFSPSTVKASLQYIDHTDWLTDSRIELRLARHQSQLAAHFVIAPACLKLAEDAATLLKDKLKIALNQINLQAYFADVSKEMQQHIAMNHDLVQQDHDVSELFNRPIEQRVVVVAGGPTASQQFAWLQKHRADCTLIAVSTALQPLLNNQLMPDIVVVIDHKQDAMEHFQQLNAAEFANIPLVYLPAVHHDVLDWWQGPRFVCVHEQQIFKNLQQVTALYTGGTVTHTAIDLAVKMGAIEIVLLGADFCYIDNQSHLQDASSPIAANIETMIAESWVINGNQQRMPSTDALITYLRNLEDYIQQHPNVAFYNTGKQGAQIAGAAWLEA